MQSSKRKNVNKEQFYTKPEIAKNLSNIVKNQKWFNKITNIIEPSAGRGDFSSLFESCIAYDIDPQVSGIKKQDFLKLKIDYKPNTLVIGNPPFGRYCVLALKFIKKSFKIGDYVAFILPASFNKKSIQNRIPLTHSLILNERVPNNAFYLNNNESRSVNCVFQVWFRKQREKHKILNTCNDFKFIDKSEYPDFAIRRVGYYAGKIIDNFEKCSVKTHYFIKCISDSDYIRNILYNINWNKQHNNSTKIHSISKHEIIEEYFKQIL